MKRRTNNIKVSVSMPQSKPQWNEYLVETGQFDWAKLKQDNKDLTDKILGFAGARLVLEYDEFRYLPDDVLPHGLTDIVFSWSRLSKHVNTTTRLVLERPRHDILSHGPHEKMTVTFSSCVDRNWWGFARYAEDGWPLDREAVCAAMDFKQTFTDVIKIRLVPRNDPYMILAWHVEVVRQHPITGGEEIHGEEIHGEEIHGEEIHGEEIHGEEIHGEEITVRIGKDPGRHIDYLVCFAEEHEAISRRLREQLHLRHVVVEGADEFSS
jgi:hypothetical protein